MVFKILFLLYTCLSEYKYADQNTVTDNLSSNAINASTFSCKKVGYQCKDCHVSVFCNLEQDKWSIIDAIDCGDNYCDDGNCKVIPTRDCLNDDRVPRCGTSAGVFPDPSSCKKYYTCAPNMGKLELVHSKCKENFAYNARTTHCDVPLPGNTCKGYPVPDCTSPGQSGALQSNASIYYMCLPLVIKNGRMWYPYLNSCKNRKVYHAPSRTCV